MMFDSRLRQALGPILDLAAARLDRPGITPDRLTVLGLLTGLASAVTAATQLWWWSLVLWLVSRLLDGLDGPLARRRRRAAEKAPASPVAGGFLDITADFVVYGSTVLGVAIGVTSAYSADWQPFAAVLLAYYVNGTAFLAFSSSAERSSHRIDDGRSFSFLGGLAEGAETIAVHTLWLILPEHASVIAIAWSVVVALSGGQRIITGYRLLSLPQDD
ncbi:MAG: CDP-alcohol phosphatidyltransferase family protein [Marmoricola sp.]